MAYDDFACLAVNGIIGLLAVAASIMHINEHFKLYLRGALDTPTF